MYKLGAASFALLVSLVAVAGGWEGEGPQSRRQQVLEKMTTQPDLLVNLPAEDLPATDDMIRLGRQATPAIINGLINNMDASVRESCASVLTATRDPAALKGLLDALDDPEPSVRWRAVQALGTVESREATPRLLDILGKKRVSEGLKLGAIEALGRLGDPKAVKPLLKHFESTWDDTTQQALWNLREHLSDGQLEDIIVAPLEAAPDQVSDTVLRFSIEKAGLLKLDDAVKPLTELFDRAEDLRNPIIYSLGLIGSRKAVPFLEGLVDSGAEARQLNNVLFALDRLGRNVEPFLKAGFGDARAYIRFNAAFVTGDLKKTSLVPELIKLLSDPNDFVRSEVAVALGRIGAREAIPALEAASREKNPIVRRDALLALGAVDYAAFKPRILAELVPSELRSVSSRAVQFLASHGDKDVVPVVLAALSPEDGTDTRLGIAFLNRFDSLDSPDATAWLLRVAARGLMRGEAFRLLARFKDERARFVVRQWLSAPSGEQTQLLRVIGRFQDQPSLATAKTWMATTRDPTIRLYAAFALAQLSQKEGTEQLLQGLEQGPIEQKRTAALLLTEVEAKVAPDLNERLAALLSHADVYVRLYAARALSWRDDDRAFESLKKELDKRIPFIREEALDIFERAPEAAKAKTLERWLSQANPHLKRDLQRIQERSER